MSDYISRQAAIDSIVKQVNQIFDCNELMTNDLSHELAAFALSQELIKDLPSAQPAQKWIPCSERLPEYDGEMYLVTDYCEQINRRRIHISYCYVNREGFWSDVPIGYKVIAWMPLPEPYKRGEE